MPIEQRIFQLCQDARIPLRMNGGYCVEVGTAEDRELLAFCQRTMGLTDAEGEELTFEQWQIIPFTIWGLPVRRVESPSYLAVAPK